MSLWRNKERWNHDMAWPLGVRHLYRWHAGRMLVIPGSAECQGQHCRIIEQAHHEIRGEAIDQRLGGFCELPQAAGKGIAHNGFYLPANNRSALTLDLVRA